MRNLLLSTLFALLLANSAQACTAPPIACNLGTGILLPGTSVQEYGGTAGPVTLAPDADPEWNWSAGGSYTYVYAAAPNLMGGQGHSWLGHSLALTWQWSQPPPLVAPGSGHTQIVTIHCVVIGNDGELWYDATEWQYGFYDQGSGNAINCSMPALDGQGLGPTNWFNRSGWNAHANTTVARQYATLFGNNQNMFAFGLVFGDNECTPSWAGSNTGNVNCWTDGAYAGRSHFKIISVLVY